MLNAKTWHERVAELVDASVVERVGRMTDEDQYLNTIFMFWTRTLKHNYRFESCLSHKGFFTVYALMTKL